MKHPATSNSRAETNNRNRYSLSSLTASMRNLSTSLNPVSDLFMHVSTQLGSIARTPRNDGEDRDDAVQQNPTRIERESEIPPHDNKAAQAHNAVMQELEKIQRESGIIPSKQPRGTTTHDFTDSPIYVKSRWGSGSIEECKEAQISEEQEECKDAAFTQFFTTILEQNTEALKSFDFSQIEKTYEIFNQGPQKQSLREFIFANIRRQLLLHRPSVSPDAENPIGKLIDALHRNARSRRKKETEGTAKDDVQFVCLDALYSYGCLHSIDRRFGFKHGTEGMSLECLVKYCNEVAQMCLYLRDLHANRREYIIPSLKASSGNLQCEHLRPICGQAISLIINSFALSLLATVANSKTRKRIDPLNPYKWPTFSKETGLEPYAARHRKAIAKLLTGLEVIDFKPDSFIKQNYIFICALAKLHPDCRATIIRSLSRAELLSFLMIPIRDGFDFDFVLLEDFRIHADAEKLLKDLHAGTQEGTLIFSDTESKSSLIIGSQLSSLHADKLEALRLLIASQPLINLQHQEERNLLHHYFSMIMSDLGQRDDFDQLVVGRII